MKRHPLQSGRWAEFREKTGVKVIKKGDFVLSLHPLPYTKYKIGYLPKGNMPSKEVLEELKKIALEQKCIFIQLEPRIEKKNGLEMEFKTLGLIPSAHPLFTKYTFILDIDKDEEELLKNMDQKTRYNIRLSQRKGVIVKEDNSDKAFEQYLRLLKETTQRQKFYAHSEKYHRLMWETLRKNSRLQNSNSEELTAHLLKATYKGETLVAWILFVLGDTIYYPYGASSTKYKETMASNLMMWEAIKFGQIMGLKKFDMWGSLGENPNPNDPWFGFHKFKQGYGARLIEFVGSYDLVINPFMYTVYKIADKIRWFVLRFK
ncbi:MAG: hypothetical protein A2798_00820 [Candidatus Levybacteria bacterium RIFCSPHIGHO2_01_FULL_37_17]|nr:MAG: hypothetical protein A2798_00820 [Candidatus Levybacteria bacterium RIFCSPHIGHO2_01_FULL_37_17]OGH36993.1 MAG: hypothetical protein A2959_01680 [Candidatus Levybacteria bacterium RIFCSPLOWO2_01_FULL_38_23]